MNKESIEKLYGKKMMPLKENFCLTIIGRLKCYHSLDEVIELCKLATVEICKIAKLAQELEKTINCFNMLPQIEKDARYCATDDYDEEVITEPAST